MTHFLAVMMPVTDSEPIDWPGVATVLIVTVGTVAIFGMGLYLIGYLWRLVLEVISEADTKTVSAIVKLVGHVAIERKGKFGAVGVGLLGTILILAFCLGAVVWGLNFSFGGE